VLNTVVYYLHFDFIDQDKILIFNQIFLDLKVLFKKKRNMDEIRAKRLEYFQSLQSSLTQNETVANQYPKCNPSTSKADAYIELQPERIQIESNIVDPIVDTRITFLADSKLSPGVVKERKESNVQVQELSKLVLKNDLAVDDLDIIIIDPEEVKKDLERRRLKVHKEEANKLLLKKREELKQRLDTKSAKLILKKSEITQQKSCPSKQQVNKFRIDSAIAIQITEVLEHKLFKVSENKSERRYKVLFKGNKEAW
jgi:hypothetical protein